MQPTGLFPMKLIMIRNLYRSALAIVRGVVSNREMSLNASKRQPYPAAGWVAWLMDWNRFRRAALSSWATSLSLIAWARRPSESKDIPGFMDSAADGRNFSPRRAG